MDQAIRFKDIKHVAVIGAGNAGITAAKYLLAEKAFTRIDIFEQRSQVGGLWIYNPVNDVEDDFSIPQTTAAAPVETPIWRESFSETTAERNSLRGERGMEPQFISPLYERLESNLPKTIMKHSDLDFPNESQLFPTHECVLGYLERYADDVLHLIHFEKQIQDIQRNVEKGKTVWSLTIRDLPSSSESIRTYDAVVLSSGHFMVPFVPDIPGIREWNESYPNSVSHSKHFRRPEDFKDKKMIAIGRGYSGLDIASQLTSFASKPLIISTYQPGASDEIEGYIQRPEIAEFLPASSETPRAVRFIDGHVETDIEHILFCTGYMYSFPFLPVLTSKKSKSESRKPDDTALPPLITDGARPRNLYQYLFYNFDPTLAVFSMPQQIVPFPITESQGAVVARAWAGRLDLPSRAEMLHWEEDTVKERGEGKKWLWLKPPLDGQYLNSLADWADQAREGPNGVLGKEPARWGEKDIWLRARVLDVKKAFVQLGERRREVRTLEELGFDFEKWKREQAANGEVID